MPMSGASRRPTGAPRSISRTRASQWSTSRRPVIVRGELEGVLASTMTIRALSEFITGLETELGQNAFVLYDRSFVLAHNALALDFPQA